MLPWGLALSVAPLWRAASQRGMERPQGTTKAAAEVMSGQSPGN